MAGMSDVTDQNYLRTKPSTELVDLDFRLSRSIDELTAYRRNVIGVLRSREFEDHPLYGILDRGEEP